MCALGTRKTSTSHLSTTTAFWLGCSTAPTSGARSSVVWTHGTREKARETQQTAFRFPQPTQFVSILRLALSAPPLRFPTPSQTPIIRYAREIAAASQQGAASRAYLALDRALTRGSAASAGGQIPSAHRRAAAVVPPRMAGSAGDGGGIRHSSDSTRDGGGACDSTCGVASSRGLTRDGGSTRSSNAELARGSSRDWVSNSRDSTSEGDRPSILSELNLHLDDCASERSGADGGVELHFSPPSGISESRTPFFFICHTPIVTRQFFYSSHVITFCRRHTCIARGRLVGRALA